jgi:elongation factor P
MKATDLRPGLGINMDGKISVLTGVEHRTPGNLRAFVQIKYKEVLTGKSLERRLGSGDTVDVVDLDRRPMEFLFADMNSGTFMDSENYEQVELSREMLGDTLLYLPPNTHVTVLFFGEKALTVELPPAVELVVKDCPPAVKNATATNQTKDAEMETGLKITVPAFITIGEKLKISTVDGSYLGRA